MSAARKNLVKVREVLPAQPGLPAEAPRMEHEPIHKRLARLVAEQERLVAEIQSHKSAWADRNRIAQDTHQPPATPEIQAFKQHHRDLATKLADVNLQIGIANKEVRAHKAERQSACKTNGQKHEPEPKKMPFADDPEFPQWFLLAAKDTLVPSMYAQVLRTAKAMIADARRNGIE